MTPRYALTGFLKFFRLCVGGDAHIAPLGSYEFAGDFRKNRLFRRVDAGIDPYGLSGSSVAYSSGENTCKSARRILW